MFLLNHFLLRLKFPIIDHVLWMLLLLQAAEKDGLDGAKETLPGKPE